MPNYDKTRLWHMKSKAKLVRGDIERHLQRKLTPSEPQLHAWMALLSQGIDGVTTTGDEVIDVTEPLALPAGEPQFNMDDLWAEVDNILGKGK